MATTEIDLPAPALRHWGDPDVIRAIRRARLRRRLRENLAAYLFLAPTLVVWTLFMLLPVVRVVRQSFQTGGVLGPARWVGLDNWSAAVHDPAVRDSVLVTLRYTAIVVPIALLIGLGVALLLRELGPRTGRTMRVLVYIPTLAPLVIVAIVWAFMFNPDFGVFANAADAVGAQPVNWIGNSSIALYSIGMVDIWRGIGFWALLFLAALLTVSHDLYSAAKLDGARSVRRLWHVTLPGIRPTLVITVVLATLFCMQLFDVPYVLTSGGPDGATESVVLYVYQAVFERAQPGMGAVVSIVLLAIIVVLTSVLLLAARPRRRRR